MKKRINLIGPSLVISGTILVIWFYQQPGGFHIEYLVSWILIAMGASYE